MEQLDADDVRKKVRIDRASAARKQYYRKLRNRVGIPVVIIIALLLLLKFWPFGKGTPVGQVVATVNGEEITLQDLNAEARARGVSGNVDPDVARRQLTQLIVQRTLLAQSGAKQELDRDPEFLAQQRRIIQSMLAQKTVEATGNAAKAPSAIEISDYIRDHPLAFAQRQIFSVDRLRFPMPTDTARQAQIKAVDTMPQAVALLQAWNVPFDRDTATIGSEGLPPPALKALLSLPPGGVFYSAAGGVGTLGTVLSHRPAPLAQDRWNDLASRALLQERKSDAIRDDLKRLQDTAKIEYQKGFEPLADKAGAAKTATK